MKLRVAFRKHGPVKFIGHLDTQRFFQRSLKRAGWDVAYSQGFSPHPILSFAAPLGVGIQSDSEIFDIEMVSIGSRSEMMASLNDAMCDGMMITDIRIMDDNSGNAMASVAGAAYTVDLHDPAGNNDRKDQAGDASDPVTHLDGAISKLMSSSEILINKKTKKSESVVDIKPGIFELKTVSNGIYMLVDASSGGNIRPEQVVGALYKVIGTEAPDIRLHVTRNEIYGRSSDGNLTPLIEFGNRF